MAQGGGEKAGDVIGILAGSVTSSDQIADRSREPLDLENLRESIAFMDTRSGAIHYTHITYAVLSILVPRQRGKFVESFDEALKIERLALFQNVKDFG